MSRSRILEYLLNIALVVLIAWLGFRYYGLLLPSTEVKSQAKAQVVMYSTKWCPACIEARAYFNRKGIRYFEYDLNQSVEHQREFRRLGGHGVPLIVVGKTVFHGLNKDKLHSALQQLSSNAPGQSVPGVPTK